ncbi:MAG: Type 4 prepilin-like protein leader peptide-processing enzyme [candidate division WWE3 bacterium GW2011_GWA1_46_21]|uniref:Type 4 prepilin-like protein leader peptide-processing enzyme n=3 Tax=Katanobacteria TaxID=422282 RepID=A0A0G1RKW9_UNCKA|nr:MAG: Type 4 prepilin-like protein leader peptide-processing enzyme [candidate division WWE3 bacterium GW2011_GWA1_46_21]KKU49096.1 MAG: Type 4 prepilin-like protein leader peptide-processing enzyme [candidate division WWE3 bacterium GW2011_GWA2_46_9]KKU57367.1 MAG: Type 4 prepilin-like protein leader peptide-processing enzyme [candidate division WWE3 bacterium GW2011_GWB1_47_11]
MEILFYSVIFIAGAFIGSFLNLVSDRLRTGEPILFGRSHCDFCKKNLSGKDLLPLLSFILQKGKCRYCQEKLAYYYPLSETLTAATFVSLAYYIDLYKTPYVFSWIGFGYLAAVACFFIIITLSDLKYRLIPNRVVYPAIAFVLLFMILAIAANAGYSYYYLRNDEFGKYLIESGFWTNQLVAVAKSFGISLLSSLAVALFFWFLIFITKGKGMGGGDVKLAFLVSIFNGFPQNIVAVFAGFVLGALFSFVLILLGKKTMKDTLPFGPFLVLGSVLAFVYGQQILDWYLSLL